MQNALCLRRVSTVIALSLLALAPAASGQSLPTFDKSFVPDTIGPGSVTTVSFLITAPSPVRDAAFVDNLPAGMTIAAPANASASCLGSIVAPPGGSTITFSGGEVFSSCTITVDVTSSTPGASVNTTGDLTSTAGNSGTASATLTVDTGRPGFSKSFSPSSVFFGGRSTLTFEINNSANGTGAISMFFTDNLPSGMVVAGPANVTNTCAFGSFTGGVVTAVPGTDVVSLSFGGGLDVAAVDANSTCEITVDVLGNAVGSLGNTTGELTTQPANGGASRSSGKAAAVLTVSVEQIAIEKSFIDDPVAPGGTVTLQFTIRNLDRRGTATNIEFSDDLDAVLSGLEAISLPSTPCGSGSSITGTDFLTFEGGELASEATCTFNVTLQVPAGAASGSHLNTTSAITADIDGSPVVGDPASDLLFVDPVPILTKTFIGDPVGSGDSIILEFSITNTSTTSTATDITFEDVFVQELPTASFVPSPGFCGGATATYTPLIDTGTGNTPARLVVTGAELDPEETCTFSLTLDVSVSAASGTYPNVTSEISATIDGERVIGNPASDTFDVVAAPELLKEFTDDPASAGGTVTLQFTLSHDESAPGDATDITFTDDLTATLSGLTASGLPLAVDCGEGAEIDGTTNLSFTGGTLAPGESCSFSVTLDVPAGALPGSYNNTTSNVVATVLGATALSDAASDDLLIAGLTLTKEFTDDPAIPGDSVNLRFTIDNISPSSSATDIFFQDNLDTAVDNMVTVPTNLVLNDICGSGSSLIASSGGRFLTFSGGSLDPADPPCEIDVTVLVPASTDAGSYVNTTQSFRATIDGTPNVSFENASDTLEVVSNLILFEKEFIDDPVGQGDPVTLRFTLTNLHETSGIDDIAFTDDLEATLSGLVATALPASPVCGGTVSGSSVISFSGGSLAAAEVCFFDVTLTVPLTAPVGTSALNVTSDVTGTLGGLAVSGDPAIDELLVDFNTFTKAWSATEVLPGSIVTLTFTLGNLDPNDIDVDLNFSDNLDAVIPGLEPIDLPQFDICGEGSRLDAVEVGGDTVVLFTRGSLLPSGTCTFSFDVQIPEDAEDGDFINVTSDLLQGSTRAAQPATAEITVEPPPAFSKSFSPDTILEGGVSTLTFVIDNTGSPSFTASDLDFTDVFPAGLEVADPANVSTDCAGGTLTAAAGSDTVAYSGGTIAAGASCSVQVDVTADTDGEYLNVSGDLTSSSGNSGPATATLTVDSVPDDDGDGVDDGDDFCPGTVIPERVPTVRLGVNRFALVDGDLIFDTTSPPGGGNGPGDDYTTTDTGGCSCEQIIVELGLGQGHMKFGCSLSAMREWVAIVQGGGLTQPSSVDQPRP